MFTIQYETVGGSHKLQTLDSTSRQRLIAHLARFQHPISAVYEQATPITKAMRKDLATWTGTLSRAARDFINCHP